MQSKISCFNKTIFKKNVVHFWPVWTIYTLILLLLMPAKMLFGNLPYEGISGTELKQMQYLSYLRGMEMSTYAGFIFVVAVICAMAVFYYMYTAKSANMMHAFPVNRTQLYVTNYLSGLLFLFCPQIFTFFISMLVCLVKGIAHPEYLLIWLIMTMGTSLFAYSMAVMIGMLTGQFFVMPVFFFIANYLYMAVRFMLMALVSQLTYGMSENMVAGSLEGTVFSPLHWMAGNVGITSAFNEHGEYYAKITGEKAVAVYAAVGIIFAVVGLILYRKKELETVGDFITEKWLKPVFRWGSTLLFSGLMAAGTAWAVKKFFYRNNIFVVFFMAAVCAVLVFFIAQMFLEKKFKVFSKNRFLECAVLVFCIFVIVTGVNLDVFGVENKIPEAEDVKSVFIYMDYAIEVTEQDELEEVLAVHKKILASKENLQKESEKGKTTGFTIRYVCKDGTSLERYYDLPFTKEYYEKEDSVLKWAVEKEQEYENCMKYYFGANYKTVLPTHVSVMVYNTETKNYEDISLGSEYVEEFYQALQKDIKEGKSQEALYLRDDKKAYTNSVTIDYYNPKGIENVTEKYFIEEEQDDMDEKNDTACIEINTDCKHMLEAVEKSGCLDKNHKFLTYAEEKDYQ